MRMVIQWYERKKAVTRRLLTLTLTCHPCPKSSREGRDSSAPILIIVSSVAPEPRNGGTCPELLHMAGHGDRGPWGKREWIFCLKFQLGFRHLCGGFRHGCRVENGFRLQFQHIWITSIQLNFVTWLYSRSGTERRSYGISLTSGQKRRAVVIPPSRRNVYCPQCSLLCINWL